MLTARGTYCGEAAEDESISTKPNWAPLVVGVTVTWMLQDAEAEMDAGQLFVWLNSDAFRPTRAIAEMATAEEPVF